MSENNAPPTQPTVEDRDRMIAFLSLGDCWIVQPERDLLVGMLQSLSALEKDAARYRWLRLALFQRDQITVGEAEIRMKVYGMCPSLEDVDTAIDLARGATP